MIAIDPSQQIADLDTLATPQQFADVVALDLGRSVAAIIAAGSHLLVAKERLGHGEWLTMFAGHERAVERPLPIKPRFAQMLMRIARHPVLVNAQHVALLPPTVRTLHALAALPEATVRNALDDGRITPEMEQRDAEALGAPPAPAPPEWPAEPPTDPEGARLWAEVVHHEHAAEVYRQKAVAARAALLQRTAGPLPKTPARKGPLAEFYAAAIAAGAEFCSTCCQYHEPSGPHLRGGAEDWHRSAWTLWTTQGGLFIVPPGRGWRGCWKIGPGRLREALAPPFIHGVGEAGMTAKQWGALQEWHSTLDAEARP